MRADYTAAAQVAIWDSIGEPVVVRWRGRLAAGRAVFHAAGEVESGPDGAVMTSPVDRFLFRLDDGPLVELVRVGAVVERSGTGDRFCVDSIDAEGPRETRAVTVIREDGNP